MGKVQSDLSVKVYQATDFGSNIGKLEDLGTLLCFRRLANILLVIDFTAVEAVVDATHRYKEIFYDGND